jgi:putative membrane protein
MIERERWIRMTIPPLVLAVLAIGMTSCSNKSSTTSDMSNASNPPAGSNNTMSEQSTTPPATMSDANIAAVVVAANKADVANGKEAKGKSKNPDVTAFAQQMITDHTASNNKATALAGKLKLTPEDNETSKSITAQQDSIRGSLKSMSGAAFDRAYIDNEVTMHQTVLDALDHTLIPSAQNAELKQLLTATRPVIAEHLDHAKKIQNKMSNAPTP